MFAISFTTITNLLKYKVNMEIKILDMDYIKSSAKALSSDMEMMHDNLLNTAEKTVEGTVNTIIEWQSLYEKALKNGSKLMSRQQNITFSAFGIVKNQLTTGNTRFRELFGLDQIVDEIPALRNKALNAGKNVIKQVRKNVVETAESMIDFDKSIATKTKDVEKKVSKSKSQTKKAITSKITATKKAVNASPVTQKVKTVKAAIEKSPIVKTTVAKTGTAKKAVKKVTVAKTTPVKAAITKAVKPKVAKVKATITNTPTQDITDLKVIDAIVPKV